MLGCLPMGVQLREAARKAPRVSALSSPAAALTPSEVLASSPEEMQSSHGPNQGWPRKPQTRWDNAIAVRQQAWGQLVTRRYCSRLVSGSKGCLQSKPGEPAARPPCATGQGLSAATGSPGLCHGAAGLRPPLPLWCQTWKRHMTAGPPVQLSCFRPPLTPGQRAHPAQQLLRGLTRGRHPKPTGMSLAPMGWPVPVLMGPSPAHSPVEPLLPPPPSQLPRGGGCLLPRPLSPISVPCVLAELGLPAACAAQAGVPARPL